jgi:phospholipid-binding lipoprotein MlaA
MSGCATSKNAYETGGISDPMEEYNRVVFNLNDSLDRAIAEPIARGYRAVVPSFVRKSVGNFLRNARTPVNAANQLLQGDVEGAAGDVSRMMMNTVIGVGGLFDVAAETGLMHEHEDFGQTLAVWGLGHGSYLVIPFFGPSSFRDASGLLVDAYADPLRLYLHNTDQDVWQYARTGMTVLDTRTELLDALDDLRANSFDYYAAMRSAYVQRREALVRDQEPGALSAPAIPDYDDE